MSDLEWRLLSTLPDLPSAQSIAGALAAAGMEVRVSSDAGVLGQAAPSRIYIISGQFQQAQAFLAAGAAADEA